MKKITTTLTTEAVYSDDHKKRYLLRKRWDAQKPSLAVIMFAPSAAAGIELDSSTLLVLNNASRLGYGCVSILNLFSTLNDFALRQAEDEDAENLKAIVETAKKSDTIVYAAGVGKAKVKAFLKRQEQVITALTPYASKLHCLCDESGSARLQHPLSPAVRKWNLSPLDPKELLPPPSSDKDIKESKADIPAEKPAKK